MSRPITLKELAGLLGVTHTGDGEALIKGVATLDEAREGDLSFLANPKYAPYLAQTKATAAVVEPGSVIEGRNHLVSNNPYLTFAQAVAYFNPPSHPGCGVSREAHVDPTADVHPTATVMAGAHVEAGASVGAGAVLYPGVYVGVGASIGSETVLYPNAVVRERCVIGERVILQPNCVVGSDGFGFATGEMGNFKFQQIGIVVIEDDVEIGAGTTIDRAALGKTVIGRGTKIDNLVQVAHNVRIGQNTFIAALCGISGSATVGSRVMMGGQTGVAGHIKIGDGAQIGGKTGVTGNLEAGAKVQGWPIMGLYEWLKAQAGFKKLPELRTKVARLEERLKSLEDKHPKEEVK